MEKTSQISKRGWYHVPELQEAQHRLDSIDDLSPEEKDPQLRMLFAEFRDIAHRHYGHHAITRIALICASKCGEKLDSLNGNETYWLEELYRNQEDLLFADIQDVRQTVIAAGRLARISSEIFRRSSTGERRIKWGKRAIQHAAELDIEAPEIDPSVSAGSIANALKVAKSLSDENPCFDETLFDLEMCLGQLNERTGNRFASLNFKNAASTATKIAQDSKTKDRELWLMKSYDCSRKAAASSKEPKYKRISLYVSARTAVKIAQESNDIGTKRYWFHQALEIDYKLLHSSPTPTDKAHTLGSLGSDTYSLFKIARTRSEAILWAEHSYEYNMNAGRIFEEDSPQQAFKNYNFAANSAGEVAKISRQKLWWLNSLDARKRGLDISDKAKPDSRSLAIAYHQASFACRQLTDFECELKEREMYYEKAFEYGFSALQLARRLRLPSEGGIYRFLENTIHTALRDLSYLGTECIDTWRPRLSQLRK